MDFTEIMTTLKEASLYELYRLRAALNIEMENPEKINLLYNSFAVGDQIAYFNDKKNALCKAIVLEKNIKYVRIKDLEDNIVWNTPYYAINITGQDSQIYHQTSEKLTRNHLCLGEIVGFMHDGKQIVGHIEKFNPKTVSLITSEGKHWRVGYGWLFKILEGNQTQQINGKLLIEGTAKRVE